MMRPLLTALAAFLLSAGPGLAHDFEVTPIAVVLSGDQVQIELSVDADALALGLPPNAPTEEVAAGMAALDGAAMDAAVERAKGAAAELIMLRFDGRPVELSVTFPHQGTPAAATAEIPSELGGLARLRGEIPAGARAVTLQAGEALKTIELKFFGSGEAAAYLLNPGEESPGYPLAGGPVERQGVWGRYIVLGFEHILPKGLDHILFVLGLFLLSARVKPLLWQVTAFTVAHSVTLALSMMGVVSLPSQPVEVLIALSIAYVAVENMATKDLKPWRPFVVFGFGLLHGLGFAGVLRELGMPDDRFVPALIAFNVGVEAGQLAVIGAAFLAVGWFRERTWYRSAVAVPASAAIAAMGVYWAWERSFG